eukprot:6559365-Karenia_brevis.AAC.1
MKPEWCCEDPKHLIGAAAAARAAIGLHDCAVVGVIRKPPGAYEGTPCARMRLQGPRQRKPIARMRAVHGLLVRQVTR